MKPIKIREELLNRNIHVFTQEEFRRIFNVAQYQVKYFLETQTKEGLFIRLKKGLYALRTDLPTEEEISNKLYMPSYISFDYALSYYGLIPETTYSVTSATTKPTRSFIFNNIHYSYRSIKIEAYTGYTLKRTEHKSFLIAEPEKAIADYLYFVSLRKSKHNERLLKNLSEHGYYKVKEINKKLVYHYLRLYERDLLDKLAAAILK